MDNQFSPNQQPSSGQVLSPTPSMPQPVPPQTPPSTSAQQLLTPPKSRFKKILWIILVIILIAAAGCGAYYWQHQKVNSLNTKVTGLNSQVSKLSQQVASLQKDSQTSSTGSASSTSSTNQYAGWNTYTLPKEKLTFRYPTTWTVAQTLTDSANDGVVLSSKSDSSFELTIGAGPAISAIDNYDSSCVNQADQVTFAGQTGYLDFIGAAADNNGTPVCSATDNIKEVLLSSDSKAAANTNFFSTKNISNSKIVVDLDYFGPNSSNTSNDKSLSAIESDADYKDVKLVVDSMSY